MSTNLVRIPKVLFWAPDGRWKEYAAPLARALAETGIRADVSRAHSAEDVDYVVYAPRSEALDFTPFKRCRAILGLWAGVETIVTDETLTQPLTRMVDTGLERGMVEWVTGHVLRHHLGMDAHILGQDGIWRNNVIPPLAPERRVTVLGLGVLGSAVATTLAGLGFSVTGWSRTPHHLPGIRCLFGEQGISYALTGAEILVLLLPLTSETQGILNADRIGLLPRGAVVINPGRGPLIDDEALLAALDTRQIGHATLDVFATEPLPPEHPYWAHPHVTVTPHIASETRPETAARVIAENIRRSEMGEPLLYLVDRSRGY